MNIGEKIKKQRVSMHMTQQQVADLCHKDVTCISKIENGDGSNHIQTIKDVAAALGCAVKINLVPNNYGTVISDRQPIIDEASFEIKIDQKSQYIESILLDTLNSNNKINSIWDLLPHIKAPKYKGIFLAEIQNNIIDQLLCFDLENLNETDSIKLSAGSEFEDLLEEATLSTTFHGFSIDKYDFVKDFSCLHIFDACVREDHCALFSFSKLFINRADKKAVLNSIKKENKDNIAEVDVFLEENPNGFPFVCFLKENRFLTENTIVMGYDTGDIWSVGDVSTLDGRIIFAWSKDEAVDRFLKSVDYFTRQNYYEKYLLNDLLECMFYDDMSFETLVEGEDIRQKFEGILKEVERVNLEDFKVQALKLLSFKDVVRILGSENLNTFFDEQNRYKVVCFLDDYYKAIYDFIV